MKNSTSRLRTWSLLSIGAVFLGVAVGASNWTLDRQYFVQGPSATDIFLMAGGNARFDSDIARLDTRTGAVYRFRGDVDNASVRNTWELRVEPVKGDTSGILEIQRVHSSDIAPTIFLVDVVNGRTWILRHRASTNATWDPVDLYRSAQFH